MEENLPPGFRFHPTDEELISYYLGSKVCDSKFKSRAVADVDLNKCEPWDLPAKASMGEKEWYFFSLRDRKYPTGLRTNRATEAGYWKTTGKDKDIFSGDLCVGMKKTLVFYRGRAPKGHKTNWVMHEYRLQNYNPAKEEWVVCRVFEKSNTAKKNCHQQQQQQSISPEIMLTEEQANDLFSTTNNNTTHANYIDSNYNEYIEEEDESYNNRMMMGWSTTAAAAVATNYVSNINSLLLTALQLRAGGYHQYRPTSLDVNYVFDNLQASTSNPVLPPPPMDQPLNHYSTNNGELEISKPKWSMPHSIP